MSKFPQRTEPQNYLTVEFRHEPFTAPSISSRRTMDSLHFSCTQKCYLFTYKCQVIFGPFCPFVDFYGWFSNEYTSEMGISKGKIASNSASLKLAMFRQKNSQTELLHPFNYAPTENKIPWWQAECCIFIINKEDCIHLCRGHWNAGSSWPFGCTNMLPLSIRRWVKYANLLPPFREFAIPHSNPLPCH